MTKPSGQRSDIVQSRSTTLREIFSGLLDTEVEIATRGDFGWGTSVDDCCQAGKHQCVVRVGRIRLETRSLGMRKSMRHLRVCKAA